MGADCIRQKFERCTFARRLLEMLEETVVDVAFRYMSIEIGVSDGYTRPGPSASPLYALSQLC